MADNIKIRSIETKPGEKKFGYLDIAELPSMRVTMPLMVIHGVNPGPTVSITSGVHSAEFAGIEATTRTFHQIDPANLSGTLLIVPVVNIIAFQFGNIPYINPIDNLNMNRIFPGNPNGSISYRLIHTVFNEIILRSQYHIDCHGGDIGEDLCSYCNYVQNSGNNQVDEDAEMMARLFAKYIYPIQNFDGVSSWEAAKKGIPSIVSESGAMGTYKEEHIQFHLNGIHNILKHFQLVDGPAKMHDSIVFTDVPRVSVTRGGIFQALVQPGDQVEKGQKIGTIKNIFGELVEDLIAPEDSIIKIIFPKRVKTSGDTAFSMWKLP